MLQAPRPDSVIRAHESKPGAGQCLNSCCHNQRERERLAVEQPPSHHLGQSGQGQLEIGDFSDASINQAAHPHDHVLVDGAHIKTEQGYGASHSKGGSDYSKPGIVEFLQRKTE